MSMFSFLSNLELNPAKSQTSAPTQGVPRNPTKADIRVFRSGAIFPSKELVEKYDLNYYAKTAGTTGNAFDIIDSREWPQYPMNAPIHAVFIAVTPKSSPKSDLFSATKYLGNGQPLSNVLDQGTASFGKELLEVMADVYGYTLEQMYDGKGYVDLIITEDVLTSPDSIYWFPKAVARGPKKGQIEVIRRENTTPHLLIFAGISAEFPFENGKFVTKDAPVVPIHGQIVEPTDEDFQSMMETETNKDEEANIYDAF